MSFTVNHAFVNHFENCHSFEHYDLLLNWSTQKNITYLFGSFFSLGNTSLLQEPHILKTIVLQMKNTKRNV